jgi:hypothetical protein
MRCAGHVARISEPKIALKTFVGKTEAKEPLETSRSILECNINLEECNVNLKGKGKIVPVL